VNKDVSSSSKSRLRRLSAEEIALWLNVTQSVARRPGSHLPQPAEAEPTPRIEPPDGGPKRGAKREGPPSSDERVSAPPPPLVPLERRLRLKLARGRAAPEAVIDLHGMRRQEAFAALREFLTAAQREGARLVLVVTGKGERNASGEGSTPGILRQSVPNWLRQPLYHSIIAGFEEAQRPHGGAGAFYVRLRRRDRRLREKGTP